MFGAFAYLAAGIAKSILSAAHTRSRKAVEAEILEEGQWIADYKGLSRGDIDSIVERFDGSGFRKTS